MNTKTQNDGRRPSDDAKQSTTKVGPDDDDNNLRFFLGDDAVDVHIPDCPVFLKVMRKSDGIYCRVLPGDFAAAVPTFKMKERSLKQANPVAEAWLAEMQEVLLKMFNRWR